MQKSLVTLPRKIIPTLQIGTCAIFERPEVMKLSKELDSKLLTSEAHRLGCEFDNAVCNNLPHITGYILENIQDLKTVFRSNNHPSMARRNSNKNSKIKEGVLQ